MVEREGGRAAYCRADVSKAADCEHMIEVAEKHFGKLDVLFNNAGIMHSKDDDALSTDEAIWDLTMNINAKGVFFGCKYGIPALRRADNGFVHDRVNRPHAPRHDAMWRRPPPAPSC